MKGETIRYDGYRGTITEGKRDIGGNTYVVMVRPAKDKDYRNSHLVVVYADEMHGEDHGFIDGDHTHNTEYDSIVKHDVPKKADLAPEVSKAVNKAVKKLTNKLDNISSTEDAVLGALDANKEVHGDG